MAHKISFPFPFQATAVVGSEGGAVFRWVVVHTCIHPHKPTYIPTYLHDAHIYTPGTHTTYINILTVSSLSYIHTYTVLTVTTCVHTHRCVLPTAAVGPSSSFSSSSMGGGLGWVHKMDSRSGGQIFRKHTLTLLCLMHL